MCGLTAVIKVRCDPLRTPKHFGASVACAIVVLWLMLSLFFWRLQPYFKIANLKTDWLRVAAYSVFRLFNLFLCYLSDKKKWLTLINNSIVGSLSELCLSAMLSQEVFRVSLKSKMLHQLEPAAPLVSAPMCSVPENPRQQQLWKWFQAAVVNVRIKSVTPLWAVCAVSAGWSSALLKVLTSQREEGRT